MRWFRRKYKWKCKECGWKLVTESLETFTISKSSHVHLREYEGVQIRTDKGAW